ncbi:hypothetical protein IZU89_07685 [Cellulophaga lytica]|uniref:hypothetical protein n=1 Tax=Cellulophaga lytica TaxID=979 RepID=UPI0032E40214
MENYIYVHPTELNYFSDIQGFSLEVYFIQTLIYLYEKKVLKISEETNGHGSLRTKEYSISIATDFFSYSPEVGISEFVSCLSEKNQTIGLIKFIEITIGNKISKPKWSAIFPKKVIPTGNELNYKNSNAFPANSKYFNYLPINETDFELINSNPTLNNIFITTELKGDYEMFDFIYEQSKAYVLDKLKNSKKWHWGKANASGGV